MLALVQLANDISQILCTSSIATKNATECTQKSVNDVCSYTSLYTPVQKALLYRFEKTSLLSIIVVRKKNCLSVKLSFAILNDKESWISSEKF